MAKSPAGVTALGGDPAPAGPEIELVCSGVEPRAEPGAWDVTWAVRNVGAYPLVLREAWLPHGRFRSPRRVFTPPIDLGPAVEAEVTFPVDCAEEPGAVVENGFVILVVDCRGESWRIFARLRIPITERGVPAPVTETFTIQRDAEAG
jgi:hypothetical protein